MLNMIKYPGEGVMDQLLQRPYSNMAQVATTVQEILSQVKIAGDQAVRKYTACYDNISLDALLVSDDEWAAIATVPGALKEAIDMAFEQINKFHLAQKRAVEIIETVHGVQCWRRQVPVSRVGLYIPGGSAPLFSTLLMLGIPAVIAGCRDIVVCTPAQQDGTIHPAVLYVADKLGLRNIYKAGGAQAIAAMAYGTESIPAVYKIFGPGNRYVTAAKLAIQSAGIAIDMPAGPSEVAVIADGSSVPAFVAADLIAQAEHGADSHVLLVSTDTNLIAAVTKEIEQQVESLPRKDIIIQALQHSKAILVRNLEEGINIINRYAPEHLIINTGNALSLAEKVENAGSVFIGNYSPEAAGDYASGTNHTLPTNGYATAYSGVSVDSFMKHITYQQLTKEGLENIGKCVETMAVAEGLQGHARSVTVRLKALNKSI